MELTSEHIRQSTSIAVVYSCRQALTKDISTPADIAPSALETIIFYCFMGYISALTYYLLLIIIITQAYTRTVPAQTNFVAFAERQ